MSGAAGFGDAGTPEGVPELTDALRALRAGHGAGRVGPGPDLSARILGAVEQRRPFVSRRGRMALGAARGAAVMMIASLLATIVYVQVQPGVSTLSPAAGMPQPMTDLVRNARADAQRAASVGTLLAGGSPRERARPTAAEEAAQLARQSGPSIGPRRGAVLMTVALPGHSVERPGETASSFADELSLSLSDRGAVGAR